MDINEVPATATMIENVTLTVVDIDGTETVKFATMGAAKSYAEMLRKYDTDNEIISITV